MVQIGTEGNVLVLGHGARAFLSVIRSLGRAGRRVHVGMCPADDLALRSKYVCKRHHVPEYDPANSGWLDALVAILKDTSFDLVVPCSDPSLIPLQIHKDHLSRFAKLYTLDDRAFDITFDKIASSNLAVELGIPVARRKVVSCSDSVGTVLEGLSLPVVIKPPSSFHSADLGAKRAVFRARTAEEAQKHLLASDSWGEALVEENFIGTGVGVELLAQEGEVLVAFQHVRVHEPLEGGGSSYRKSAPLDADLERASRALMKALNYTGVAMVEFKFNFQTGEWIFIEINGRFWGSLPLALAAKVDFPLYLYQMLVNGREDFPQKYRSEIYCRNLTADRYWMTANLAADRDDPVLATRPLGSVALEVLNLLTLRERWDSFAADDLRPGIEESTRLLRDTFQKVAKIVRRRMVATKLLRKLASRRLIGRMRRARSVLFVCKGNICRSPFAEQYARRIFPDWVEILSAGYYPVSARPSPAAAVASAKGLGVDLTPHRSVLLDEDLVRQADVILVFDEQNRDRLLAAHPRAAARVFSLGMLLRDGSPMIADPYGGDEPVFLATYHRIAEAIDRLGASLI